MSMAHGSAVEKNISAFLDYFLKRVLSMQIENWQRPRDHELILVLQRHNEYRSFNALIEFIVPCNITWLLDKILSLSINGLLFTK